MSKVELYNGDCLEVMDRLVKNRVIVDAIITSPPYNLGGDFHTFVNGKRVTYGDYGVYNDNKDETDYQNFQIDFLNKAYDVLGENGVIFYNHKNRIVKGNVISPFEWISKTKFNIMQVIVMNLKSTPNVDKRRFFPVHELIFILTKNKDFKLNNKECFTDVWEMKKVSRKESGHPATFHVDMPLRCINSLPFENGTVLDPFMGSGTTGVACANTNRSFVGIELDETYFKIAQNRINEALAKVGDKGV
jgi:site-specific DNA-methyltransferase (adenine-specific)